MRIYGMKLPVLIVGEIVLLLASVLVFRSLWMILDLYLEYSYIDTMLIVGIALTIVALFMLNHGMFTKAKNKKSKKK